MEGRITTPPITPGVHERSKAKSSAKVVAYKIAIKWCYLK
jgi:hypothetical protein